MSLVETTKDARIFLKVGGAAVICIVLLFLVFKGGQFVKSALFPTPPPPAEKSFGQLPSLEFPISDVPLPEFSIETISGFLPTFLPTISVYELLHNEPTITALPDARVRAKEVDFLDNEQAISQSEYKWTKQGGNNALFYDIYSLNFSVTPDYSSIGETFILDTNRKEQIDGVFTNFITTLGGNLSDIKMEDAKYSYFSLTAAGITPVESPSDATLVRVDLFQNPVNDIKIYYPSVENSLLFFTVANTGSGLDIQEANYHHFVPNLSKSSTYDLKTAQEAFDELKAGKGYIVQPTTDQKVAINQVELGYYLTDSENQKYLQPIIVFKGANKFQAYVSAVKN